MTTVKKQTAPETISISKLLDGINHGTYYVHSLSNLSSHGFEPMTVDIDAAEFDVDCRYQLFSTEIPQKKRGNLSKYAGKEVEVVVKGIAANGPRVNFWIREKK